VYNTLSGNHKAAQRINWHAILIHPDNRKIRSKIIYHPQRKVKRILNIIALDTSGSTLASEQLSEAKAVVKSLCQYSYQQRQHLTLLCFGNQRYDWLITAGKAPMNIDNILNTIQAGGGTPLRQTLLEIQRYSYKRKQQNSKEQHKVFFITDGRSRDKLDDITLDNAIDFYVLDSERSSIKLNKAYALAIRLNAIYVPLFFLE
jgi:magnesium chelatase subunit D